MTQVMTSDEWNKARARSNAGKAGAAGGRGFEADLEYTHRIYRSQLRADIVKLPVPTVPMPRAWLRNPTSHGGIARVLSERQRADYFGTVLASGITDPLGLKGCHSIPIAMEAKATSERAASLPILAAGKAGFGVKIHQLEGLVHGWRRFGTVGVLVWRNGFERLVIMPPQLDTALSQFRLSTLRRIPIDWAWRYAAGRDKEHDVIEDWLSAVLAWMASPQTEPGSALFTGDAGVTTK